MWTDVILCGHMQIFHHRGSERKCCYQTEEHPTGFISLNWTLAQKEAEPHTCLFNFSKESNTCSMAEIFIQKELQNSIGLKKKKIMGHTRKYWPGNV